MGYCWVAFKYCPSAVLWWDECCGERTGKWTLWMRKCGVNGKEEEDKNYKTKEKRKEEYGFVQGGRNLVENAREKYLLGGKKIKIIEGNKGRRHKNPLLLFF